MLTAREGKMTPKKTMEPGILSWEEKKRIADIDADILEKQIEDLKTWTNMIDSLNDEELKEYLKNRPGELKTVKSHKNNPRQRIQKAENCKCSTSYSIMASGWKFHKEEE